MPSGSEILSSYISLMNIFRGFGNKYK